MKSDKRGALGTSFPNRILGSLRDALAAANREPAPAAEEADADERTELLARDRGADRPEERPAPEPKDDSADRPVKWPGPDPERHAAAKPAAAKPAPSEPAPSEPVPANSGCAEPASDKPAPAPESPPASAAASEVRSAAQALREAKMPRETTEPSAEEPAHAAQEEDVRTRLLRGRPKVKHDDFHQDPVVGWLVVVGGPGLGAFRPVYEGNNTIGRARTQRVPIDFGDNMISAEEQAYIRYDSVDRSFLLVPNLTKTNVVAVNNTRPTGAVKLEAMDMITMGRTQLAFVPFCGEDFDWSELAAIEE
jgi:hypothetical protein